MEKIHEYLNEMCQESSMILTNAVEHSVAWASFNR
jgi:hypothetical protein